MDDQALDSHPFMLTVERMLTMYARMTDAEWQALSAWEQAQSTVADGWLVRLARLAGCCCKA
jgi:hypothetical protein